MARFRSGTLERSVKRFGRFPSFGGRQFKKKQFGYLYAEVNEQAQALNGDTLQIILFDGLDWQTGGSGSQENVRNVSGDVAIGLAWTPQNNALTFDSVAYHWGIFCNDVDDSTVLISALFASHRALKWDQKVWNSMEIDAEGFGPDYPRQWNWRVKFRQRFMRQDDQLQFAGAFQNDSSSTIADARVFIFARFSWEIP